MNTVLKRLSFLLLSLIMIISVSMPAFANSPSFTVAINDAGVEVMIDENGYEHSYYDAYGNPLTIAQAMYMLNNTETLPVGTLDTLGDQLNSHIIPGVTMTLTNHQSYYGTDVQVSPEAAGPATITYGYSQSFSWGWSVNLSVGAKGTIKWLLDVNYGIELKETASTTVSFSASFPIPEGKIGAVYFRPKKYSTTVHYEDTDEGINTNVTCNSPGQLPNGFADGVYHLITRDNDL